MSDEDPGFFRNLTGLANAWVSDKRRSLQAEDPTTNVDEYGRSGGKGSYQFGGQDISHSKLRDIKQMRESGGTVSQLMHYKSLLHFGEGVEISVGDNEETEQSVDGYPEPLTLKEWLQDNFDSLDQLLLELGEDALWYPYAVGEIRQDRTGGFADFLPAQPWTLVPETDAQGEIIAWHEETRRGASTQTRTLAPDEIEHLVLHKNSARDTTGISEVLRNEDEIMAFKENEMAIRNAIELHGFPQRHVKVGREEGAPVRDQELRRVRTLFDPSTTDANTAYFTGQDVDVESLEAEQFDYSSIHEMNMRQLTTALGLPLEVGNVGADGLGSGKPAELRMALLKLTITANQRMFCRQFVDSVMRPVIERYSPFDAEARIELGLGDPLEDIGDMAQVIQQIGDHLTNDEIREKLDMAPHEDEEIGESYRTPAEIETPEEEQGGGLDEIFNSQKTLADIPQKYTEDTGLSEDDFVPNELILDVVEPTLAFIDEHGLSNPDDQQEGAARINQLKDHIDNNEPLEPSFWQEILNFHKRHRAQGNDECDESSLPEKATEIDNSEFDKCHYDNGWFSDRTWGGDPAFEQAERIVSAIEDTEGVQLESDFSDSGTGLVPPDAPEWEAQMLSLHEDVTNPNTDGGKELVGFTESTTPEFVKNRITDAIRGGALFSEFDTIPSGDLLELRNAFTDVLTQDSWTINELRDSLADQFSLTPEKAEVVARTETAAALNSAREDGYEEQGLADESRFYWTGATPGDSRQTEACEWLIEKTNPFHGGTPVALEELRELVEEAPEHDDEMDNNLARPDSWTVHPNERSTFARAPPS